MQHTWDVYFAQARVLRTLATAAGASDPDRLALRAITIPPLVPKLGGLFFRAAHQRAVTHAVALLPRALQAQVPPIALLSTLRDDTADAEYTRKTGVIALRTNAEPFQRAMRGKPLLLAAVLRHELDHHLHPEHGEAQAYDAEIAFLRSRQAPASMMTWAESAKASGVASEKIRLGKRVLKALRQQQQESKHVLHTT
ncbi:MAG: hypothetical protein ABJA98_32025 [Acidobacteriota bacterium]